MLVNKTPVFIIYNRQTIKITKDTTLKLFSIIDLPATKYSLPDRTR